MRQAFASYGSLPRLRRPGRPFRGATERGIRSSALRPRSHHLPVRACRARSKQSHEVPDTARMQASSSRSERRRPLPRVQLPPVHSPLTRPRPIARTANTRRRAQRTLTADPRCRSSDPDGKMIGSIVVRADAKTELQALSRGHVLAALEIPAISSARALSEWATSNNALPLERH